ncbi:hypothetical protein I3843_07G102200 [Carya illinoinensis]|nr:uncharacterized protein LOC122317150 isoform X4 [Carya illinoinensis]KAG2697388.1 hypothetical protein I3760_07G103200 [Carya illinoinensis]KAG7970796.1 hypothetical protein I3843_07G102200 [Carya illinoinensis]
MRRQNVFRVKTLDESIRSLSNVAPFHRIKPSFVYFLIPFFSPHQDNSDSDQSISEDEDLDADFPETCEYRQSDIKEELQLPLRLDLLKGAHRALELDGGRKTSHLSDKKETNVSQEDDVEMPLFDNEEKISDDEENIVPLKISATSGTKKWHEDDNHSFGRGKQDEAHTWSNISKEADALIWLNKNAPGSSSHYAYPVANKPQKGMRCKAKRKFSFRFQSREGGLSCPSISNDEKYVSLKDHEASERLETIEPRSEEHSIAGVVEDYQRENEIQSEVVCAEVGALGHGGIEQSMSDLLDGLQDRAVVQKGVSAKQCSNTRGKEVQIVTKRNPSSLGDRTVDSEDSPESMDSGSSSEDEARDQKLEVNIPDMKRQTMTDRFQAALGATFLNEEGALVAVPKPSGIGLFGKLQQLMQSEKERDVIFLKKLQTGSGTNDEASCIVVKILARCLDAKMTVCQCSFVKNMETPMQSGSPRTMVNGGRKTTIIFHPRVSGDVDLEVGNLIRIHPPWREVQVGNDESIVLSTYFSQVLI